jgi:hypothetical protein
MPGVEATVVLAEFMGFQMTVRGTIKSTGAQPASAMNKALPAMPISDSYRISPLVNAGILGPPAGQFSSDSRLRGNHL